MNFTDHHRLCVVMLSEAKHLRASRARPFASPSLHSGLRLTQGDTPALPVLIGKKHYRGRIPLLIQSTAPSLARSATLLPSGAARYTTSRSTRTRLEDGATA